MCYRNANAALCVYDVTSRTSFFKAREWIKELQKQAPRHHVGLVGNKVNLDRRDVEASRWLYVDELNPGGRRQGDYSRVSGQDREGVLETFAQSPRRCLRRGAAARSRVLRNKRSGVDLSRRRAAAAIAGVLLHK